MARRRVKVQELEPLASDDGRRRWRARIAGWLLRSLDYLRGGQLGSRAAAGRARLSGRRSSAARHSAALCDWPSPTV